MASSRKPIKLVSRSELSTINRITGAGADDDDGALGYFKAKHIGSVPVNDVGGGHIIVDAVKLAKANQAGMNRGKPRHVFLVVTPRLLQLIDVDSETLVQAVPITQLVYSGINPDDKKNFCFTTKNKAGAYTCHLFLVKDKAIEIPKVIALAFKILEEFGPPVPARTVEMDTAVGGSNVNINANANTNAAAAAADPFAVGAAPVKPARSGGSGKRNGSPTQSHATSSRTASTTSASSGSSSGRSVRKQRAFDAFYLGSIPVEKAVGSAVVLRAVKTLEENRQKEAASSASSAAAAAAASTSTAGAAAAAAAAAARKKKIAGDAVTLVINDSSIRTVERLSGETIMNEFISLVSFTSIPRTGNVTATDEMFAYISTNENIGVMTCHIFNVAPDLGQMVCTAIRNAVVASRENQKKRGANPFLAVPGSVREEPKGALLRKQIHRDDLKAKKVLGAGQFGEVYLAIQSAKRSAEAGGGTIFMRRAVKMVRLGASAADKAEFLQESDTMLQIGEHDNLVKFVGVAVQQAPWLAVIEFCQYGDLRAVVKACKEKKITLLVEEQLSFCHQLASGCAHMAAQRFIHMDLAARNCLLGNNNRVKVADFGLTRPMDAGSDKMVLREKLKLPLKWVSIEGLDDKVFSEKSDCWSFGVLMWELVNYGITPYWQIRTPDVQKFVREGNRLEKPQACNASFWSIIADCWHAEPEARPSFTEMMASLQSLKSEHPQPRRDIGLLLQTGGKEGGSEGGAKPASANDTKPTSSSAKAGRPTTTSYEYEPAGNLAANSTTNSTANSTAAATTTTTTTTTTSSTHSPSSSSSSTSSSSRSKPPSLADIPKRGSGLLLPHGASPLDVLDALGFPQYKDAFKADNITAFIFKRIDESMLKDLGVVLASHRKKIMEVAREDKLFARQKSKSEIAEKLAEAKVLRKQASMATELALSLQTPDEGTRSEARVQAEETLANRNSYMAERPQKKVEAAEAVRAAEVVAHAEVKADDTGTDNTVGDAEATEMELLKQEIALLEAGDDDAQADEATPTATATRAAPKPTPPAPASAPARRASKAKPTIAEKPKVPPKTSPRRKAPRPAPRRASTETTTPPSAAAAAEAEAPVVMRRKKSGSEVGGEDDEKAKRLSRRASYIEERQAERSAAEHAASSKQEAAIALHAAEATQIANEKLAAEKAAEEAAATQRSIEERQKEAEKEEVYALRAATRKQQTARAKVRTERAQKLELSERGNKLVGTRKPSNLNLFGDAGAGTGAGAGAGAVSAPIAEVREVRPEDEWGYGKSKIWKALNPQPIAFQTGRDRDDREVNKVMLRGQDEQRSDYAFLNDVGREDAMSPEDFAENIVDAEEAEMDAVEAMMAKALKGSGGLDDAYASSSEEEEEEEEDVDPDALAEIDGDFMAVMLANRAVREKEAEDRKATLREEHIARKKQEDEDLAKELAVIRAKQSIEHEKQAEAKSKGLKEAQDRLANDLVFSFTWGGT